MNKENEEFFLWMNKIVIVCIMLFGMWCIVTCLADALGDTIKAAVSP